MVNKQYPSSFNQLKVFIKLKENTSGRESLFFYGILFVKQMFDNINLCKMHGKSTFSMYKTLWRKWAFTVTLVTTREV